MKTLNYWQQFTNTGRIEDYLSYIDQKNVTGNDIGRQKENAGVYPYAGIHMCNRNDFETGAYRGI